MKTAIIYGSNTGRTEAIATKISAQLPESKVFNVSDLELNALEEFDFYVFGTSTWGTGELQDDWERRLGDFKNLNLSEKTVAFFGLGDQKAFCETFLDAMGLLYERFTQGTGQVLGETLTQGYQFDSSRALRAGKFVGLGIDEDNQPALTDSRIKDWVENLLTAWE